MQYNFEKLFNFTQHYRGIHPGSVIEFEIKRKQIPLNKILRETGESEENLSLLMKCKTLLNVKLALQFDRLLGLVEGSLFLVQSHYVTDEYIKREAIAKEQKKMRELDLTMIRPAVFKEMKSTNINWKKQYQQVIRNVFLYGNESEKKTVYEYYGQDKIWEVTGAYTYRRNKVPKLVERSFPKTKPKG